MDTKNTDLEIRLAQLELEVRDGEQNQPNKLVGYAIRWNELSGDLGGFRERVLPGATKTSIANNDIRALVSHDPDKLLGRTSNNTLTVAEDDKGLRVEITVPDTTYGRDLTALVKRGDLKQMSFGFRVPDGGERFIKNGDGQMVRELSKISLHEVSAVATPAYSATSLAVRVDPSVQQRIRQENSRPNFGRCQHLLRSTLVKG